MIEMTLRNISGRHDPSVGKGEEEFTNHSEGGPEELEESTILL